MMARTHRTAPAALVLCAAMLLLLFSGCGGDPTGKIFRYDLEGTVTNLDPQFTTESSARIVLDNLYEGLVVQSADGEILPGVAKGWDISADGRSYTFQLRTDARWADGKPVLASDFLFAFTRLFADKSPHAMKFLSLKNAGAVLEGQMPASALGVQAESTHLITITLERSDPQFLTVLADPAAAPCNEAAFSEARGRYGLEEDLVYSNGPFALRSWSDANLQLRQSEHYHAERETVAGGVNFYIGRSAAAQFLDGKTDVALLSRQEHDELPESATSWPVQKTVWCIVFNQNHSQWSNPLLRQGLALAINREEMAQEVPASFRPATLLVPDAMRVMSKPYRERSFSDTPMEFDTLRAQRLFEMGLTMQNKRELPTTTILVPEEARANLNMAELQQGWQKELSAFISFENATASDIQSRLQSGDYGMLIMPLSPGDSGVDTLLNAFRSDSSQNYFAYRNPIYDQFLDNAAVQSTPEAAAARYAQAEKQLLVDATVVPLYFEESYLALASGVSGVEVSPFGDRVYFKYAQKEH